MESQAFFKIFLNYFLPSCIRAHELYIARSICMV
ncbi:hypothetical protein ETTORE_0304 [Pseudomonas phage Ettore]|nr:hypothetical protein ETTORE_0304 [Pseudomonas phage Ettore]